jgi:CPA2 family monovalent cation:H+ antiporter-2
MEFGAVILGLGLGLLGRFAGRLQLSPIPLYLLAGLAFGEGGLLPMGASEEFVALGAEIGVILLLLMLGLEYSASDLVSNLKTRYRPGWWTVGTAVVDAFGRRWVVSRRPDVDEK